MLQKYNMRDELIGFTNLETGGDGLFQLGKDGVKEILTPLDKKVEFILFEDKTSCYVKSAMGYPAIYPVHKPKFEGNTKAVLMDLDGTSVHSESFWMWIIEQTIAKLTQNNNKFELEASDEPHVSGLYNKAMPEIISAFKTLGMGDPLDFYDAIITAGQALVKGQAGTMGELAPKPHPWLYSETARVGLGLTEEDKGHVLGFEDSSAGVVSIRLAGFSAIGINGGNIRKSGVQSLCLKEYDNLCDALPLILS